MGRHRGKIILAVVVIGTVIGIMALVRIGSRVGVNEGYEPDQPIPYSHKIHAGEYKIPCLYCHFGAEKSRHAGIPPLNVCMNCHKVLKKDTPEIAQLKEAVKQNKPIEWIKVHNLPDFVYFNHSQHVIAGVVCQDCHGPVETMTRMRQDATLTMGWCIDCHRKKGITPPEEHKVHFKRGDERVEKAIGGQDCSKCHY